MSSPYLKCSYTSIDKPIEIIERAACCGATDYYHIAYVTTDHARLLNENGIGWLAGEPDWKEHYDRIELMKAKRMKMDAEKIINKIERK